jgi:hypothetical protein
MSLCSGPVQRTCLAVYYYWYISSQYFSNVKFGSIPLKDQHFGSIPLLSHLHVDPLESMTCGVHGIYLKFRSFNGIDPIVTLVIG